MIETMIWRIALVVLGMLAVALPAMAADDAVTFRPTADDNMYEFYQTSIERGRPTLITSDSVLHSAHVLFDYTLRAAELRSFDQRLRTLTATMMTRMAALAQEEAGKRYLIAPPPYGYDRVAAYYGVAQQLLDPDAHIPEIVRPVVEKETALILAHNAQTTSPVTGVLEDYTQYVPRGHYTRNVQFQRFFRAMMWYGRAGFPISGEKAPGVKLTRDEARANAWAGMMLARNLTANAQSLADWQQIDRPTAFLVGTSDDLTPPEYLPLIRDVFGDALPGGWTPDVQEKTDRFIAKAISIRPPRIVGTLQTDKEKTPSVALRLFGQRFTPDSDVFQRLVHPLVPQRFMPTGLDIMAALNAPLASDLLKARGDMANPEYARQLATVQREFSVLNDAAWQKTAYQLWLRTIRDTVIDSRGMADATPQLHYPAWWHSTAWQAKRLNAGLGSWAELRHDTILYVKQSYTMLTTAVMRRPDPPTVYVEPVPQVYGDLIAFLTATREHLTNDGVFPGELAANYDQFIRLLRTLQRISTQEILPANMVRPDTAAAPNAKDYQQVRQIGNLLRDIETLPEPLRGELIGTADAKAAVIADVHTDGNSGQVLEVGVGRVMLVSVPVEADGTTVMVTGPIFSYYEFAQPMGNRLTDEAWQGMLTAGTTRPPFILQPYLPK